MPVGLFAGIVVVFVIVGVMFVRSSQKRRIVERLPLEEDEDVLLEEDGLKVFHRFRRRAVRDGGTVTYRVRAVLTDRRILVATGGPEGKHKFVILMILDYTTPARGRTRERVCGLQEEVPPRERLSDVRVLGRGRQPREEDGEDGASDRRAVPGGRAEAGAIHPRSSSTRSRPSGTERRSPAARRRTPGSTVVLGAVTGSRAWEASTSTARRSWSGGSVKGSRRKRSSRPAAPKRGPGVK